MYTKTIVWIFLLMLKPLVTTPTIETAYCENNNNTRSVKLVRCKLGIGQRKCVNWRIAVTVYLANVDGSDKEVIKNNIESFMQKTSRFCDGNSFTQLYLPEYYSPIKCPSFYRIDPDIYKRPDMMTSSYIEDINTTNEGTMLYSLLSQMKDCLSQTPLSSDQGGAAFIFTDLNYNQMCTDYNFGNSAIDLIQDLVDMEYSVIIHHFKPQYSEDRVLKIFEKCAKEMEDCYYLPHNYTDEWSELGTFLKTCPHQKQHISKGGLLAVILMPTIIIVLLLITFLYHCQVNIFHTFKRFFGNHRESSSSILNKDNRFKEQDDDWEIKLTDVLLKENEILGNGAFGTVCKAIIGEGKIPLNRIHGSIGLKLNTLPDGTCEAAVKRLPAHSSKENKQLLLNEIQFMKTLGYHAHVISMLGCVTKTLEPLLFLEYCSNGDLKRFLTKNRQHYSAERKPELTHQSSELLITRQDLVSIAWQISDGMTYLSGKDIIHRDLAARNILLTKCLSAKIADFGMCRTANTALYTSQGGRLPVKWMALESLKYYEFSVKSDVWSFGIVLFEIFSLGCSPFGTIDPEEIIEYLEQGHHLSMPDCCPREIYAIMRECWSLKANERPDFITIREDLSKYLHDTDSNYNYLTLSPNNSITEQTHFPF